MCVSGMTGQNLHFILSFICPGKAMLKVIISQNFFLHFLTSCPESIVLQSVTGGQCSPAFLVLHLKLVKCVGMTRKSCTFISVFFSEYN